MDFTLCDCSCRIGRFRCTDTAVRSTAGGKVCGANTLGTAEEDLTRNGAAARPCHRRAYREHSRDDGTLQYIYHTGICENHGGQDCQGDGHRRPSEVVPI